MDGKLFVVPIKGNGDLHAVISKYIIEAPFNKSGNKLMYFCK